MKSKTQDLFFIILNFKNYRDTIRTVRNIQNNVEYNSDYGILVVDNNSPNESFKIISEEFSDDNKVYVIKNKINSGYAGGNNFGAKYIELHFPECKYIAIINPDVLFFKGTDLSKITFLLEKYEDLAAISPVHLLNNEFHSKLLAWKIPSGFDDLILNFSVLQKLFDKTKYKKYEINDDKLAFVEVLPGSFFVIKNNIFKHIDYFDENTFLFCEERILAKKLKNSGFKQAVYFESFYLHDHSNKQNNLKQKINNYNTLLKSRIYFNKNYNEKYGKSVAFLLYLLYPLRIAELSLIHLLKNLLKR